MAERRFIEHRIIDGDRLDLLAYQYWGDCNYSPLIVIDNQHLSAIDELPEGEICYIREVIGEEDVVLENDYLPFWKR